MADLTLDTPDPKKTRPSIKVSPAYVIKKKIEKSLADFNLCSDKKADSSTSLQAPLHQAPSQVILKLPSKRPGLNPSPLKPSPKKAPMIPKPFIECKYYGFNDHHSDHSEVILQTPVPQDRRSREKHIKLVNIIGKPLVGIIAKSRIRDSDAASASKCLQVNFLYEMEPKKLIEALEEEGCIISIQKELNQLKETRYLKGTPNHGFWYPKGLGFDLKAYSDSNYAGCNMDRKSTSGGCQILRGKLVLVYKLQNMKKNRELNICYKRAILLKKQVTETQHADVTVATADATKSLEASKLAEEQENQPSTAEAVKVLDQHVEEEKDVEFVAIEEVDKEQSLEIPTVEQLLDEADKLNKAI
nr:uncharacterized mitochondrial protein AtMg00810-like [Tanacetum cinerariifolium]